MVACEPDDITQQKHFRVDGALRQFVGEIQMAVVEHSITDSGNLLAWAQSYSTSTNKPALELRSVCDTVWVKRNFNDWLPPAGTNATRATAVVAKYKVEAKSYFMGSTFGAGRAAATGAPDSGFTKLDLTATK